MYTYSLHARLIRDWWTGELRHWSWLLSNTIHHCAWALWVTLWSMYQYYNYCTGTGLPCSVGAYGIRLKLNFSHWPWRDVILCMLPKLQDTTLCWCDPNQLYCTQAGISLMIFHANTGSLCIEWCLSLLLLTLSLVRISQAVESWIPLY